MVVVASVLASGVGTLYTASMVAMLFATITPHWREVVDHPYSYGGYDGDVDVLVGLWRSCAQFEAITNEGPRALTRCTTIPIQTCAYPFFESTTLHLSNCPGYDATRTMSAFSMAVLLGLIFCTRRYQEIVWPVIFIAAILGFIFNMVVIGFIADNDLISIEGLPPKLGYSYYTWLGASLTVLFASVVHVYLSWAAVEFPADNAEELASAQSRNAAAAGVF